jgi:hypothetical protein
MDTNQDTNRSAYKAKLDGQLKSWTGRFEGLKAKADKGTAEAKAAFTKVADEFKVLEASARKQLAEIDKAGAESWHKVRDGFEHAWTKLTTSFDAMMMPHDAPKAEAHDVPKAAPKPADAPKAAATDAPKAALHDSAKTEPGLKVIPPKAGMPHEAAMKPAPGTKPAAAPKH